MNDFLHECDCNECTRIPLIGEMAPEFGANTTNGYIHFPHDYRGKWVILFSHPGDFTPVCTTEFITFQSMLDEFHALNTELIGLSVDSNSSHIAWIQTIKNDINFQGWKNVDITFPIIADTAGVIAHLYGMIHDATGNTDTVRAVFIIDPRGIIRTILYYPKAIGRNITEIKRILVALQTSDAFHVATPAEWVPGEDVVIPAPNTASGALLHAKGRNWFLRFKSISPEMILNKITNRKMIGHEKKKTKKK
ncbi:MAG: peroxiredoxin [Alphaproteobacteria bacterium]|nr:peroxiredoxin [Alphaproteobacteria bacterium]